ncbi:MULTISPECIES: beta strand repeat-containing protein, partial [unclassified Flavobacterium]|uniref:beta strand repeat-containing protein n=1 Tax=unclassified Flavobacterium TaxID=196869 RepID=UPI0025C0C283
MKTFLRKSGIFAVVFVIANLFFASAAFGQAAITSDRPDYLPGTTATFTGSGFQPGETVSIQVLHSDIYPVDTAGVEHQPWNVTADASGNFVTTWQVSLTHCLGKLLRATAIGQSSGENVWTEFTDPTITSTGPGGNWNDGGTWVGGNIPLATDDVIIAVGATVTVSDNSSAKSITLAGGSSNTKLQINSGITLSVSGNVTINAPGANGITNNLDVGAGILNVVGNVSIDGANGGTGRKGILSISTGTVDLTGNVANPSNNSNAQIKFSDIGTLKIGGNFVWGSSSTFTPGTGTVEYKGAAQTILAATYNNLSFSGTGAKTMQAATTVNGDVTINSGVTFDEAGMQMTLGSGSELTVNGTLDFSSSSGLIRSATSGTTTLTMGSTGKIRTVDALGLGPVANASLVTQAGGAWATSSINTNGTVEYYLNATQAVTDRDYNNLIITNTGTKTWTLGATRTINGNVTINSSAPLTLSGAQTLNIKGNWSNSGTFTPGSSTILFNGGSTQNIGGSAFTNFNNLSIASGTSVNLGTLSHTANNLSLGGAGTVAGTWGGTGSGAAHINPNYFTTATGKVTVTNGSCANPVAPVTDTNTYTYNGVAKMATATVGIGETVDWYAAATGTTTTTAPTGTNAGTYSAYAEARNTTTGCVSATRALVTLTINKVALTAATTVAPKVYNGSAVTGTVSLGTVSGLIGTETLIITPSASNFADANVGTGKATAISYTLADGTGLAANYSMANLATTGVITKFDVIGSFAADNKVYDSNNSAVVMTGSRSVAVVFAGDDLSLTGGTATFDSRTIGDGKTVT